MNYLILIVSTVLTFSFLLLFFRLFKKEGLFAFVAASVILANILVTQTLELFGFVITLGNAMYAASFLCTDIMSEIYGKDTSKKAVYLGFLVSFMTLVLMCLTLQLKMDVNPSAKDALSTLFTPFLRITLGSLVAYLVSNLHDVYSFDYFRKKGEKKLALRNIGSTAISQLIDTLIFCTIAFVGSYETSVFVSILISTYVLKAVLTLFAHPFFRLAVKWNREAEEKSK